MVENVVEKGKQEEKENVKKLSKQKEGGENVVEKGKQEEKNNLLINLLNYFLDKEGMLYSPSLTTYLAIIFGSTILFITS